MFGKLLIYVNSISKKANKEAKVVVRYLYGLEKWVVTCKRHHTIVDVLLQKLKKGLIRNPCIPLPSNFVENNDPSEPTCIWVKNYPFFGLGLQPLWVRKITSYKHVYHMHLYILANPQSVLPCFVVKKCMKGGERLLTFSNLELNTNLHLKSGFDFQGDHKCI